MGKLIPVPGQYPGYGFPRFADDADALAPPPASTGFTFWQYLALSITAGVTTHYIIRALEKKR